MGRIILFLLVFGAVVTAFKLAILALVLAGLIFRTKETIGLLLLGVTFTLISKYPLIGWPLLATVVIVAIVQAMRDDPPRIEGSTALERYERLMEQKRQRGE